MEEKNKSKKVAVVSSGAKRKSLKGDVNKDSSKAGEKARESRKRNVGFAALNITVHPHDNNEYVSLFNYAYENPKEIKLQGNSYAILSDLKPIHGENFDRGFIGVVSKYTKIETDNWFDRLKMRPADESEKSKIKIPKHLMPNHTDFQFIFYPSDHYLIMVSSDRGASFSPKLIWHFFTSVFSDVDVIDQFNKVEVTLVPELGALDSMLSIDVINSLEMVIRRPNADGVKKVERALLDRMYAQNASEEKIVLKATPGLSLKPDRETKVLAAAAQLNGEVNVSGRDNTGRIFKFSTKSLPMLKNFIYQYEAVSKTDFLIDVAKNMTRLIKSMLRG